MQRPQASETVEGALRQRFKGVVPYDVQRRQTGETVENVLRQRFEAAVCQLQVVQIGKTFEVSRLQHKYFPYRQN